MDVVLVNMPFIGLARPSIALGTLKSVLAAGGVRSEVVYANLLFASEIGVEAHQAVSLVYANHLLGEWLFSSVAFPGASADSDAYLDRVLSRDVFHKAYWKPERVRELVLRARARAEPFVSSLAEDLVARRPRIVACSSTFQQHVASLALLRRVKELEPGIVTLLGGANCETVMGRTTHRLFDQVDFVVSGEADDVLAPLVRTIERDGRDVPPEELPAGVLGPAHRRSGYPRVADAEGADDTPRAFARDLEAIPPPDYTEYFETLRSLDALAPAVSPTLLVETSRGCWWGEKHTCSFCGLNGRENAYRKRSPGRVLAELDDLARRYALATFETVDNILPMSAFEDLLPALVAAGRPYQLFFETKANLTRDQVRLLAEAGVRWTQPGIESLSTELLRLLGKGCEAWQNIQLLKWSRQFGIRLSWNLLSEVPGDRDEWYGEMAELLPLLEHLQPPSGVAPIQYHRFSSYHRDPARFGLRLRPAPGYSAVYPLPEEDLADLVYLFEDGWRDTVRKSPVLKMLLDGPGLPRLRQRFLAWAGRWVEGPEPVLAATRAEGALRVRDTRSVAPQPERTVTGLDRLVLLAADRAPLEKGLVARFVAEGRDAESVAESIERLLGQRLALRVDGRLVGLVLEEPVVPLPALEAGPFGRELPRERPAEA